MFHIGLYLSTNGRMTRLVATCLALISLFFSVDCFTFQTKPSEKIVNGKLDHEPVVGINVSLVKAELSRRIIFEKAALVSAAFLLSVPSPGCALASYSQNARNFERLAAGDESGGSIYDNNPTAKGARRRRAMTGCKITSAREEATMILELPLPLSEKDCNLKVMDEDAEFMLQAMRNLDCPTCPYGVNPKR